MTPSDPSPVTRRSAYGGPESQQRLAWQDLDHSAVMTVELLVAVLLYGGLGLLADGWLGTSPWLTTIGTLGGLAAGLYLVWLRSERMGRQHDADKSQVPQP